ncbi:hypothetical protein ACWFQ8_33355 [Streptomyces sp. NPDC055254]
MDNDFDRGVFERELVRHHGDTAAAGQWLGRVRWEDAMVPYAPQPDPRPRDSHYERRGDTPEL